MLCLIGGAIGLAIGYGIGAAAAGAIPGFPAAYTPAWGGRARAGILNRRGAWCLAFCLRQRRPLWTRLRRFATNS